MERIGQTDEEFRKATSRKGTYVWVSIVHLVNNEIKRIIEPTKVFVEQVGNEGRWYRKDPVLRYLSKRTGEPIRKQVSIDGTTTWSDKQSICAFTTEEECRVKWDQMCHIAKDRLKANADATVAIHDLFVEQYINK